MPSPLEAGVWPCSPRVQSNFVRQKVFSSRSYNIQTVMTQLIGTGRMNRSGGTGTLTIPKDIADRFDLDADGVDVVYLDTDDGVLLKAADEVELV